jgi:hypothetical protein
MLMAGGIVLLALEIHFSGHNRASEPQGPVAIQAVSSATPAPVTQGGPGFQQSGGGSQGTFAAPAYHGSGISVIGGDGKYCLNAIRVAVPNASHEVTFLSGTDPQAIAYMAEQQSIHENTIVDNGPGNVDTSNLPGPGGVLNQRKRVGVQKSP